MFFFSWKGLWSFSKKAQERNIISGEMRNKDRIKIRNKDNPETCPRLFSPRLTHLPRDQPTSFFGSRANFYRLEIFNLVDGWAEATSDDANKHSHFAFSLIPTQFIHPPTHFTKYLADFRWQIDFCMFSWLYPHSTHLSLTPHRINCYVCNSKNSANLEIGLSALDF